MEHITVLQAILCGIVYWLAIGNLPFVGLWTLQRPLVCGMVTGLILGHPVEGAVIGATINLIYLGFISAGGSMPADMSLAGILGTVFAVEGGLSTQMALALAAPIGILGTVVWTVRMTADSIFVHMADRYIQKEQYHKIWKANVLYPQLFCAVITIPPCAMAAYLGGRYSADLFQLADGRALTVMQILGGIMPALGIATTLRYIFEKEAKVFLFVGFLLAVYTQLPVHMIGVIALLVAVLYLQVTDREDSVEADDEEDEGDTEDEGEASEIRHILPKAALVKAWLIWETFPQTCYNYERMMGQQMAHVFTPVISYLYPDRPQERRKLMERESVFFNTHVEVGACVPGMTIALEEQKALGEPIPDALIKSLKVTFMSSLAGVGDTIWQGVFLPLMLTFCIDITRKGDGNLWGVLIYTLVVLVTAYVLSYQNFMFGYKMGGESILDMLEHRKMRKFIRGASIMGCMMMGTLIAEYVSVSCGMTVSAAESSMSLQKELFDAICPGILPLLLTLLIYHLQKHRGWKPIYLIAFMILISILGGLTGFLVPVQ